MEIIPPEIVVKIIDLCGEFKFVCAFVCRDWWELYIHTVDNGVVDRINPNTCVSETFIEWLIYAKDFCSENQWYITLYNGYIDLAERIRPMVYRRPDEAMCYAAGSGKIEVCEYVHKFNHFCIDSYSLAVDYKYVHIISWLWEHNYSFGDSALLSVMKSGDIEYTEKLLSLIPYSSNQITRLAIMSSNIRVFKHYVDPLAIMRPQLELIISNGSLDMLKIAYRPELITDFILEDAVNRGNTEMVKCLYEMNPDKFLKLINVNSHMLWTVLLSEKAELARWLIEHNCQIHVKCLYSAVNLDDVEMVKFIYNKYPDYYNSKICWCNTIPKTPEMLDFICDIITRWECECFKMAFYHFNTATLDWLEAHNIKCPDDSVDMMISGGKYAEIVWLYKRGYRASGYVKGADNDYKIVEFLAEQGIDVSEYVPKSVNPRIRHLCKN